jgi:hypothetical protein
MKGTTKKPRRKASGARPPWEKWTLGRVGQALGMIFRVPDPLVFKGPCLESTSC